MFGRSLIWLFILCGFALPGASQAPLTQSDIDALDVSRIDATINEIALQVDRLRVIGVPLGDEPAFSGTQGSTDVVQPGPNSLRARANALCFGDSTLGLATPESLDRFLAEVGELVERVDTTIASFDGLKAIHPKGACPTFMTEMMVTVDRRLGSVSRRDLSDLVLHLETCWPDDGVERQDGAPLNIDARSARARAELVNYGRSQRGFREASTWCE